VRPEKDCAFAHVWELGLEMNISVGARRSFASCLPNVKDIKEQMPSRGTAHDASYRRFSFREAARNEGSALVEFAIVLPMMFALVMGMFWFGLALNSYVVLTDAVGTGARALALADGMNYSDPCAYAVQLANSDAATLNTKNISYNITWTKFDLSSTVPYTNSCPAITLNSQDIIQVQASYTVPIPLWAPNGGLVLKASTTEQEQ
jgi:Flp pilus assembly protein TadG